MLKHALLLALALTTLGAGDGQAKSIGSLSPEDLVDAALARREAAAPDRPAPRYQSSSWLAALPSLELGYLASDNDLGTDETELNLKLPLKSPHAREQDRKLRQLARQLDEAGESRRRLHYSGLVREAMWSWQVAATSLEFTTQRIATLAALQKRQKALFEARGTSRHALLLIEQELADADTLKLEQEWMVQRWRGRYRHLTGLNKLPADFREAPLPTGARAPHPQLQLLDLAWQRQQSLLAAGSNRAREWNLSLVAKQLDSPLFAENQYGVALEVPLTLFDAESSGTASEYREAARLYWQQRDELQLALQRSQQELAREDGYLRRRQLLLDRASGISDELVKESHSLASQTELGRELWLRRLLVDLDRRAEAAVNRHLREQNLAMRRQAAGIPL